MSSLYNRATPSQARILRIVEGAVKNATDAHPGLKISPQHRRSIAKRAAGTLTAQWPDVLAARGSSESPLVSSKSRPSGQLSDARKTAGRGSLTFVKRSPLRLLEGQIASQLKALKASGDTERVAAFIDVLRMISELRKPSDTDRRRGG